MFRVLTIHGSLFVMCSLVPVMLYLLLLLLLWCPQMLSVVLLMKLVVCSSVSLETRAFQQEWLLGANAGSVLPCLGGRTAEEIVHISLLAADGGHSQVAT